ncbi:Predicted nucleic acid-binding protein, contains PIN domain [Natronoarchaeum philippinense]|uniref:Ribonuclease VapC n=1 Tax=Natronoarchaeum philippinense TaxID=558529 RepID=A0A285P1U2_NATPI|nr:PIN domain-containing protein [Natronoarchaeum philippinense]SNZ15702.1 Predicted nucleic acid-binding protein, contains PIN domain [Natronoarchaeum philippinense]
MEPVTVIYLDSWVWLEYGFRGESWERARDAIEEARSNGGVVSAIALAEVDYILARDVDREAADLVTGAIEGFDAIDVVPVSSEVALYASQLRSKYYQRRERELSYADAIHLATAALLDCTVLYTGDSDFEDVEEVDAVVY